MSIPQGQALSQMLGQPTKVAGQTDVCPHGASYLLGEGR